MKIYMQEIQAPKKHWLNVGEKGKVQTIEREGKDKQQTGMGMGGASDKNQVSQH